MAGVEHAYQYSVEVKSRFALFSDDSLNNEDPHLLLSKLQTKRSEKVRKDSQKDGSKKGQTAVVRSEGKPTESVQENESKGVAVKDVLRDTKPKTVGGETKPQETIHVDVTPVSDPPLNASAVAHPFPRVRGEGYRRGFRSRGRGQHSFNDAPSDPAGDVHVQRQDTSAVHTPSGFAFDGRRIRSRGRFRGRGFMYTDYRESQHHGYDRMSNSKGDGQLSNSIQDVQTNGEIRGQVGVEEPTAEGQEPVDTAVDATAEGVTTEPKKYTLEEYKAMRSSVKPVVTLTSKESRKANDGKDVFANMVAHRKINEVSTEEVEMVEKEEEPEREDTYEINVTFTDRLNDREPTLRDFTGRGFGRGRGSPGFRGGRPRGGPGPRGGFRGDRGRGFTRRMPPEHQTAPVLNSDQDFPSLK